MCQHELPLLLDMLIDLPARGGGRRGGVGGHGARRDAQVYHQPRVLTFVLQHGARQYLEEKDQQVEKVQLQGHRPRLQYRGKNRG